jgi:hypothetical protein
MNMTGKSTTSNKASAALRLGLGCLLVAFACLLCGGARAQVPTTHLQAPAVYPAGSPNTILNAVAMGDFDGDGYLDFAVVEFPGQVEIFFGNSDGSFTGGTIVPVGTLAGHPYYTTNHIIGAGFFNGQNNGLKSPQGIAVAVNQASGLGCPSGGVVLVYVNTNRVVQQPTCLANPTEITSVAVADFNNDGFDDIAVGNASGAVAGTLTVYFNNQSGGFINHGSYSSILNGYGTLYGTIVTGKNILQSGDGPSIALLASAGLFTQYVDVFQNVTGLPPNDFFRSRQPLSISGNGFTDIAWTNNPQDLPASSLVGIGSVGSLGGLSFIPISFPFGGGTALGTPVRANNPGFGLALAPGDLVNAGIADFAYLDPNQNLGISYSNPSSSQVGVFGPKGQGVAAGPSLGLRQYVVVDAGDFVQFNPFFTQFDEARSVAVYPLNPVTGQPAIAPLYAQNSFLANGSGQPVAFAVGTFDFSSGPSVAVLGQDASNLSATVSIFQNAYQTATPPGYVTPNLPSTSVIDLGVLAGGGQGSLGGGYGLMGYGLVAGNFRPFVTYLSDIALVTQNGITLLENQGPNAMTGPFNFILDPNCQGYSLFGVVPNPTANNCYLPLPNTNMPGYPDINFSPNTKPPAVIAVDVNGDGIPDVVVAYPENCNANSNPNSAIYVFLSNGDGTFKTPIYITPPVVNPVGLAAGKLLGSSFPDLVVVDGGEICSGTQAVTGPRTLVGAALIPNIGGSLSGPAAMNLFPQLSSKISPNISAVAVADMNGDGLPDVVISAFDGFHVLLNPGAGVVPFNDKGAVPLYGVPDNVITNAAKIDIADLNNDGFLDVAAAIGGIVYIFPGDGHGGLSTPVQGFASGTDSTQVKAIDVNGDGAVDVLVSNSRGFSVLLNDNTRVGNNITVMPVDTTTGTTPVTLTFTSVTQPGMTTLTTGNAGPSAPAGFQPGNPPIYYEISTTAAYANPVTICINYPGNTFTQQPQIFHYQNGAWLQITISFNPIGTGVCGTTSSFSPFALFQPAASGAATTTTMSAAGITYGTPAGVLVSVGSSGGAVTGSVSLSVDGGPASALALSGGSATFSLGVLSVGSHTLSANFAAQGNFPASSASGTLSVAQAPLTISANGSSRQYGATDPAFTVSYGGFVNGDGPGSLSGTLACTAGDTAYSAVGTYAIHCSGLSSTNYAITYMPGTLTITPAPLMVAANNASRPYGANNPAFTGMVTGLLNADPISAAFASSAAPASPVGPYAIVPTLLGGPGVLGNYNIVVVNGTLNVVPETTSLTVTLAPPSIPVGLSTTATVTLTAPDMVIPIDPSVLAPITVSSPIVSDILTNNGTCTPVPTSAPGIAACTITLTAVEPNGRTLNASFSGSSALAASTGTADLVVTAPLESKMSCINSDFRNVSVPGGSYLWFNSIFKVRDVAKQKVTITFFQSSVQFQYTDAAGNLVKVNQPMPDAKIVIDPNVTSASTTFDPINNVWITTIPFDLDDNSFLTGLPWIVPAAGLPADVEPVTWCGTFASDAAGIDIGWRWSAAVYSSFSADNTTLGVKPMNSDHDNSSPNHDNAGTPENFKSFAIPGARGKGGKNYTGSYSGSAIIE